MSKYFCRTYGKISNILETLSFTIMDTWDWCLRDFQMVLLSNFSECHQPSTLTQVLLWVNLSLKFQDQFSKMTIAYKTSFQDPCLFHRFSSTTWEFSITKILHSMDGFCFINSPLMLKDLYYNKRSRPTSSLIWISRSTLWYESQQESSSKQAQILSLSFTKLVTIAGQSLLLLGVTELQQ